MAKAKVISVSPQSDTRPSPIRHWAAVLLALLFGCGMTFLVWRHYVTFDLHGPDAAPFYQGMWNTLRGDLMVTTMDKDRMLWDTHFSPIFAIYAPLLLIWDDLRMLFIVQVIGFTIAGLLLYGIIYRKQPRLAPWFLAAFYLNPALHELAFNELRRVNLAVPWIALALFAAHTKRHRLMLLGVVMAVMAKEDVSLFVIMFGVYLLVIMREWKWGAGVFALGVAWVLLVPNVVIPAFAGNIADGYTQVGNLGVWGNSISEVAVNVLTQPDKVLAYIFDAEGTAALLRVFVPLGVILPFLAPEVAVIAGPSLLMALLGVDRLHRLEDWYLATVVPVLWAAIAVGLGRLPKRIATWGMGLLMIATVYGFWQHSFVPPGGSSYWPRYQITERDRLSAELVTMADPSAIIAAQSMYVPHLANRPRIYTYPFFTDAQEPDIVQYLFDRETNPYPFSKTELDAEINNLLSRPELVVSAENNGLYLLTTDAPTHPIIDLQESAEEAILLDQIELAVTDEQGWFQYATEDAVTLPPGRTLRVTVYWRALATPSANRTVSVRLTAPDGFLIAQQDDQPSSGARPTSWWEPGWHFRDIYYLTLDPSVAETDATLSLLLYDSTTQDRVPFDSGADQLTLATLRIASE